MSVWLKQSTAATKKMGPFLDDTDGKTAETGLTIAQADIRLSKNGGAFAQTNNAAGATHDENGYYGVPLDTTDTGTLGHLKVAIHVSGALPVWQEFMVVPANVWDSMFGADKLHVDSVEISHDETAADNLEADYDGTGYYKSSSTLGAVIGVTNQQLRSGTAQAGGAGTITLDAGASATNDYYKHAICALTSGTGAGQAQIIDSYVGATKVATMAASWATAPDNTTQFVLLPLGTIPGASAPSAAQVADAVYDEARADHDSAGSFGQLLHDVKAATAPKKKVADKSSGETAVYKEDGSTLRYTEKLQQGGTDDEVELVRV